MAAITPIKSKVEAPILSSHTQPLCVNALPTRFLYKIFQYLSDLEKQKSHTICQLWNARECHTSFEDNDMKEDDVIGYLERNKDIISLDTQCVNITDRILAKISSLQHLQSLNLDCSTFTDDVMEHVCNYKRLKKLSINVNTMVSDKGIKHIPKLENLESLTIQYCGITDASAEYIHTLRYLKHLDLWSGNFSNRGVAILCKGQYPLIKLDLSGNRLISDESIRMIGNQFPRLKELGLSRCDINNMGIKYACDLLKDLRVLCLGGCSGITNKDAELLSKNLVYLTNLNIAHCPKITDDGIAFISDLPLKELSVSGCKQITNTSMHSLSRCLTLRSLRIENCLRISEAGLQALLDHPNLTLINADRCPNISEQMKSHFIQQRIPAFQKTMLQYFNRCDVLGQRTHFDFSSIYQIMADYTSPREIVFEPKK